ncbi:Short-chain dehydrogenase/reductase [Lachnellula subtilissima]|uniref:Short-chain dehydrogenase/reductase n=1 Tax=Lachnellula subtilissima TaxID=602034 RepID=A0A8H8UDI7_9HELO|nr:Short-chain dehydrogenase/reductase [Lachnellula subtilissima]
MLITAYRNKFALPSLPPPGSFKGQHILITGASSGLGLASAVHFVNLGASSVIITARTTIKGLAAKAEIETATNTVGKGVVKVMELDMSSFAGTLAFAERVKAEVKELDVVLLNAGIFPASFRLSQEGWEESIQVHVLSTSLLALELLPWLKKLGGGKKHMSFVGSGNHRDLKIGKANGWPQEDVLGFWSQKENFVKIKMYAVSKLMEQYVVNEIAKLSSPEVIVNPLCPGMVKSDLAREYQTNFLLTMAVNSYMTLLSKTTEGGARSLVLTALTPPEDNGKYITHYQSDKDYKNAVQHNVLGPEGQKMQAQVWKEVLDILEKAVAGVKSIAHSA